MLHSYPLLISIYKGEGRMLIVPLIDHIAGYSIDSDWFINLSDLDNAVSVGEGVKSALDYMSYIFFCVTNLLFEKYNGVGHQKFMVNLVMNFLTM